MIITQKKSSYQISHSILPKNAIEKKTPQFIKRQTMIELGWQQNS
jgi:hypothetical protein